MSYPVKFRSPVVYLEPDEQKIVEAIAFLVAEASRRGVSITQYEIVKSLFLADKAHLNLYGRPVTFDNYAAMKHGPVPSLAYNLLKGQTHDLKRHPVKRLPWSSAAAPEISPAAKTYFDAKSVVDEDILSESDLIALRDALTTVKSLTFSQIRRLTHEDPAYVEAWDFDDALNSPMSYGLLFENPDFERAEIVKCLSEHRETIDR